jgi:hypothetical protein
MKCLTVRQPWAWALVAGPKRVENRSWATAHRGPLLIHAGLSRAERAACRLVPGCPDFDGLPLGALVGAVRLDDCVRLDALTGGLFGGGLPAFAEGPWCWLVSAPVALPAPVPWRGGRGVFDVPDEVMHDLGRRWGEGTLITALAREAGTTCFRLRDDLAALGYARGY